MSDRARWLAMLGVLALVATALWVVLAPADGGPGRPGDRARGFFERGLLGGGGLFGGGVGSRDASSAARRVSGRVVDVDGLAVEEGVLVLSCLGGEDPGRPIRGGTVGIGEDGEFEGPGCNDRVCAQLQHPSMIQDGIWVLRPGQPAELVARTLGRLEGRVLAADGEPQAAARLLMVPPPGVEDPYAVSPFVSRHASTDEEGWFVFFRIERPPCDPCAEAAGRCEPDEESLLPTHDEMLLTVRAPGHRIGEQLVAADEEGPLEVRLEWPEPPITGTLVDEAGEPYARARIIATGRGRAYDQHAADLKGASFEIDGLGDAAYDLRAVQDGIELATAQDIRPGAEVRLVGTPSATGPTLIVEVRDPAGEPLAGASLGGGPFTAPGTRSDQQRTGADGRVTVDAVIPGTYKIVVRPPSGRASRHTIEVLDTDDPALVELRLAR